MADSGNRFLKDPLLRNPVFLICLAVYAAFRLVLWQFPERLPPLFVHYLPDLLSLPVILTLAVLFQRHVVYQSLQYRLNGWQVLFALAYISILFEAVFPLFLARYTADAADVLAYALGAAIYWFWINPAPPPR